MNKLFLSLIIALLCMFAPQWAAAKEKPEDALFNNYTIASAGSSASDGCYLVRVNVTTKNARLSDADLARCAVHGVLFKGFSGDNRHFEKPLAGNAAVEVQNEDYFKKFFENQAASYAELLPTSRSVTKMDKKRYVVSQVVEVRKDQLRHTLQDAGVIRGLNSAF